MNKTKKQLKPLEEPQRNPSLRVMAPSCGGQMKDKKYFLCFLLIYLQTELQPVTHFNMHKAKCTLWEDVEKKCLSTCSNCKKKTKKL